jgi:hypothetical protein
MRQRFDAGASQYYRSLPLARLPLPKEQQGAAIE